MIISGWFRDARWIVNGSAVFVEVVFESSFCFTCVLFGAVVALYHVDCVFGVTVDVMSDKSGFSGTLECWCMKFVCQIYMYLQVKQFFLHGYEPRGWLCVVRLRSLALRLENH